MRRMRGIALSMCVATLALVAAPSRALPTTSPPGLDLEARRASGWLTYRISAYGFDPDGLLTLEVCVEEGATPVCRTVSNHESDQVAETTAAVDACVNGSDIADEFEHTFSDYGTYKIAATVVGSGCPVIGAEQSKTVEQWVSVDPPPSPVPCSQPGTPTASDVGVSAEAVNVATIGALTGPFAATSAAAIRGVAAALDAVNAAGGVCGRELRLAAYDDGDDAQRGRTYIQNLIAAEETFALVGMPSPYGLKAAIEAGDIDAAGIPVVGTSGRTAAEFASPWVWPVGPSGAAYGRIMAKHAYAEGSRRMAVVWLNLVDFAEIKDGAVQKISQMGATLGASRAVSLSESDFSAVIYDVRSQCESNGGDCDAMLLVLDSVGAVKFFQAAERLGAGFGRVELAPTAVAKATGTNSHPPDPVAGWTGFTPPRSNAAANRYESELLSRYPYTDPFHPYTEAAYVGTLVFAHALGRVGVNATRDALRAVLDSESFDLDLTAAPLTWSAGRHANRSAQAMEFVYVPVFAGFRPSGEWVSDQ